MGLREGLVTYLLIGILVYGLVWIAQLGGRSTGDPPVTSAKLYTDSLPRSKRIGYHTVFLLRIVLGYPYVIVAAVVGRIRNKGDQ